MKHTDPQDLQTTERPVEKLLELADLIERNQDRFDMKNYEHGKRSTALCGSPSCVCGWWDYLMGREVSGNEELVASEMGLKRWQRDVDEDSAYKLFHIFCERESAAALGREATAQDAAKVIRHFALKNEEDWSVAR